MEYVILDEKKYAAFYDRTQKMIQGPMLLPKFWTNELWGVLACENNEIIGGWVGKKRVKGKISFFYQEIIFDSLPLFFIDVESVYVNNLIDYAIVLSKRDGISLLGISHWSRSLLSKIPSTMVVKSNATFLVDLEKADLLSTLEHSQRKQIKKAEREGVKFVVYDSVSALEELEHFAEIRKDTQKRAVMNNKHSSILLKSREYYKNILMNYDAYLVSCVTKDNDIGSMLLFLKSGFTTYLYYSGSNMQINKETGCSSYMHWCIFNYAKTLGCRYVDMGGVPVAPEESNPAYGVYKFKKSFGGDYKEYIEGDIVISSIKCFIVNLFKRNRWFLRLLSKRL